MRLAIHFDQRVMNQDGHSSWHIEKTVLRTMVQFHKPTIDSKVFTGSLLLHEQGYELSEESEGSRTERFNAQRFVEALKLWANPPAHLYCTFTEKTIQVAGEGKIVAIYFTSIDKPHAMSLDEALRQTTDAYLGAVEVDTTYPVHVATYSHGLRAFGHIHGKVFSLFWDGISEDSKDSVALNEMKTCGFHDVKFESLNGRYSIFDKQHDPEHTILSGKTQRLCEGLLVGVAERVLNKLTDIAPLLPKKLHAALNAYVVAGTDEQIAHVALSCRRIIEYVADCLFPPQSQPSPDGRKLTKPAYRNRLLAYADKSRSSDTSIDLIVATTATLAEQLEKLDAAVNKGIHADLLDVEARRCLIRTVMLLDDMISLKSGPFEMHPEIHSLESFLANDRE